MTDIRTALTFIYHCDAGRCPDIGMVVMREETAAMITRITMNATTERVPLGTHPYLAAPPCNHPKSLAVPRQPRDNSSSNRVLRSRSTFVLLSRSCGEVHSLCQRCSIRKVDRACTPANVLLPGVSAGFAAPEMKKSEEKQIWLEMS